MHGEELALELRFPVGEPLGAPGERLGEPSRERGVEKYRPVREELVLLVGAGEDAFEVADVVEVTYLHPVEEGLGLASGELRIAESDDSRVRPDGARPCGRRGERGAAEEYAVDLHVVGAPVPLVAKHECPARVLGSRGRYAVAEVAGHLLYAPFDARPLFKHFLPVDRADIRDVDVDRQPRSVEHEQVYRRPTVHREFSREVRVASHLLHQVQLSNRAC